MAAIDGVDIIVDDLTYLKEPYYKDGIVAQAIDNAVDAGKLYISAAGNFGTRSYEASFSGTPTPEPTIFRHNFGTSNGLQKLENLGPGLYVIGLQWDDDYYSLGDVARAKIVPAIVGYLSDRCGWKQTVRLQLG